DRNVWPWLGIPPGTAPAAPAPAPRPAPPGSLVGGGMIAPPPLEPGQQTSCYTCFIRLSDATHGGGHCLDLRACAERGDIRRAAFDQERREDKHAAGRAYRQQLRERKKAP